MLYKIFYHNWDILKNSIINFIYQFLKEAQKDRDKDSWKYWKKYHELE